MIRNVGYGGGEVDVELGGLGVGQVGAVLEDGGDEVVDVGLGDVVARDDYGVDGDGGAVLRGAVDVGGDGVGAVVGAGLAQSGDVLLVKADQVDALGGGQGGDGGGRAPATMKAASILPSCRLSVLSAKSCMTAVMSVS